MNQLDVYYRALVDYRQQTIADHACMSLRSAIAGADVEQDKITIKRAFCTIDQEWIDAIESGLVHVEKALKEERQFIRSNGEVIPIEKVKHVSRESVEHLAKHSSLITRYEEDEDLIPEKLYTVERLSDYAVYENRFLYMLLCYLRDFITIRYNEIVDITHKYEAEIEFNKMISTGKQRMTYTLSMHDIKRDDPYLKENNPAKDTIDRIHLLLKAVIAYLNTPLMQEVSKVAMLKPPITKTNVLKMNNNFKGAVALYEFIMAYDKKGYEVEEQITTISPFQDILADELAEAGGLVSFLVYEYGLAINKELKESYLREEERRKVEKIKQRADRIETLKRRLKNSEISIEEYTVTLEDQLRELSGQAERAERLASELDAEREKNQELVKQVEHLTRTIENLHAYIEELKYQHYLEIERLKQEHAEEIRELHEKYQNQIRELNERYQNEIRELNEKHEREMQECIDRYETEIRELKEEHEREMQECIDRYENEISELKEKHEREMQECVDKYETAIRELNEAHETEVQTLKDSAAEAARRYEAELEETREDARVRIETLCDNYEAALEDISEKLLICSTDLEQSRADYASLWEDHRAANARIKALDGIKDSYTEREKFNELEREYNAFKRIYEEQWQKARQEIKHRHLNINNLKDQKGKK